MTEKLLTGMLGPNPNKHTSFSATVQLICAFVFAYAKSRFSLVLASKRAVLTFKVFIIFYETESENDGHQGKKIREKSCLTPYDIHLHIPLGYCNMRVFMRKPVFVISEQCASTLSD